MFGWLFAPSCPCDPAAKAWVEGRLEWLADEFDDHAFNGRRIVLPTPAFFPDPYNGSRPAARLLLDKVCGYMDVDPLEVDLEFFKGDSPLCVNESGDYIPTAAGTYQGGGATSHIRLAETELDDQWQLAGTIAHELAHVRLMGERRVSGREYDNELLTDLTVVFFGLGIFLANSPRNWDSAYTR